MVVTNKYGHSRPPPCRHACRRLPHARMLLSRHASRRRAMLQSAQAVVNQENRATTSTINQQASGLPALPNAPSRIIKGWGTMAVSQMSGQVSILGMGLAAQSSSGGRMKDPARLPVRSPPCAEGWQVSVDTPPCRRARQRTHPRMRAQISPATGRHATGNIFQPT